MTKRTFIANVHIKVSSPMTLRNEIISETDFFYDPAFYDQWLMEKGGTYPFTFNELEALAEERCD